MKLGLDIEGLKREAATLRAFAGFGAVRVFEESKGLLFLERAVHVMTLKTYCSSQETISIACDVMKKLHQALIPQDGSFPHIKDWLATVDQDWDIPTHYLKKAREVRDHLMNLPAEVILLHGDLHHDNILQNGCDWLVIDPKGIIGSPIHETWAFIRDMKQDTEYVAQFFNFDITDVRECYFLHLIKAALWSIEDGGSPSLFLGLAEKAYAMIDR